MCQLHISAVMQINKNGAIRAGLRGSHHASSVYVKAAQDERATRCEPSDRLNLVQEQMMRGEGNYDRLKRLLRDKEFRELTHRFLEIDMLMNKRHPTRSG